MLQNIRDRLRGPVVWFIVGIIAIPFAFFGIETFQGGGADPTLAKVGEDKITESQFRAGYDQRVQQMQSLMGENFRQELLGQGFRERVLDDMVQESLLRQHVRKSGYRASDATLADALRAIPAFQEDGKFAWEVYTSRLAAQGYSPQDFEAQVRNALVIDQMREGLLESAFIVPAIAAEAYRVNEQQRWLAYATFPVARYLPQVQVTAEEVAARYEDQKARYQAQERLRIAYLELALADLPPAEAPEPEVLRVIYEAEKTARFSTVEERRVRHILVPFGGDKDQARTRIDAVADQVAKGADFASLARSHSGDPGSKNKGGDLGWVRRGQMVERFEQALFGLAKGEVSAPVETEFGWHLIKVEDVRPARTKEFEDADVQAELLRMYRARDAERRYQELAEKLEQAAFESPSSLEAAAQATGLKVETSEWFTRTGGDGIAAQPAVREAAFSEDVLQAGENSRPVALDENRVVVLRKHEHEPPRQKPLEEVAETIREELKREKAKARAAEDADAALAAMASGRPLEQVVTEKRAELKAPGLVKRNATGIDPRIVEALFRLPRPEPDAASRTQVELANGDVAIVVATAVQDADWKAAPAAEQQRVAARLRDATAGAEFASYREDLRRRMKVEIVNPPAADGEPAS